MTTGEKPEEQLHYSQPGEPLPSFPRKWHAGGNRDPAVLRFNRSARLSLRRGSGGGNCREPPNTGMLRDFG